MFGIFGKTSGVKTIQNLVAKFETMKNDLNEAGETVNQQIEDNYALIEAKTKEHQEFLDSKRNENRTLAQIAHKGFAIAKGIEDFIGFGNDPSEEAK